MSAELAAAELLEKSADVLEIDGWLQGCYSNTLGEHCAVGAIAKVMQIHPLYVAAVGIFHTAGNALITVNELPGRNGQPVTDRIVSWNDDDGRTASEVIDAMKLAAKDLRNKAVAE